MSDFATVWQQYFTALDELAKAVVAENEADRAWRVYNAKHGYIASDASAVHEAIDRRVIAMEDFYEAHLALKPFLEDDSE